MVMKQTDFSKDFAFGEVDFVKPASEEDMKQGIDAWLGGIPFAWRRRRISLKQYNEISIRFSRVSGSATEYDKILNNNYKALVYIFEFTDALVICKVEDIKDCLVKKHFITRQNPDGKIEACYIKLTALPHLLIRKKE